MTTPLTTVSVQQLRRAIAIKEQIQSLENELVNLDGAAPATAPRAPRKKTTRSAATRAKMAAAQRARWSKLSRGTATAVKPRKKRKGKLSPEGRARIVAAQKARWAKLKARKGK